MKTTIIQDASGTALGELTWETERGAGLLRYARPDLDPVLIGSEALAKALLRTFAERGCRFEIVGSNEPS